MFSRSKKKKKLLYLVGNINNLRCTHSYIWISVYHKPDYQSNINNIINLSTYFIKSNLAGYLIENSRTQKKKPYNLNLSSVASPIKNLTATSWPTIMIKQWVFIYSISNINQSKEYEN